MKLFKNMRYGRAMGIGAFLAAVVLLGLNGATLYLNQSFYPKLLACGVFMAFLSLAFLIFPGGKFTQNDYPDQKIGLKLIWELAPVLHRVVWCVIGAAGLAAGFYISFRLQY